MAGSRLFICAAAVATLVGPAAAQVATSSGSRVVIDPDTRRAHVVNSLDGLGYYQPVEPVQEPIILKKPRHHKPKPRAPKMAEAPAPAETPSPSESSAAPAGAASLGADDYVSPFGLAPESKPAPKKVAEKPKPAPAPEPQPAPANDSSTIPFSLTGKDDYGPPPASKGQQQATAGTTKTVKASSLGEVRNIHINFEPGTAEPSADVATAIQSLAGKLNDELQAKSGRLLLQAFAGTPGDKSSEARRLSLKRALSVRQLLIDSGVPSDKIDVRAMGGITDGGKPDRVDVILKG